MTNIYYIVRRELNEQTKESIISHYINLLKERNELESLLSKVLAIKEINQK